MAVLAIDPEPSVIQREQLERYRRDWAWLVDAVEAAAAGSVGGSPAPPRRLLSSHHIGRRNCGGGQKQATFTYSKGGRYVKVYVPAGDDYERRPGRRDRIRGFSSASRRELMALLNSIDRTKVDPASVGMLTLTYPARFPTPARAKADLKKFRERMRYTWGPLPFVWKLEPQRRGAPHFHFLIFAGTAARLAELAPWCAHAWHEIAGDGIPQHLAFHLGQLRNSEPCLTPLRSWNGVIDYGSKYIGKQFDASKFPEWEFPGRWWGKQCVEFLPVEPVTSAVDDIAVKIARRTVRRYLMHQPCGKWRCEDPDGFGGHRSIKRTWSKAVMQEFEAFGYIVRPYHRRHRRSSRGGIACYMRDVDAVRLLDYARKQSLALQQRWQT